MNTNELKLILSSPRRKLIAVDLDDTLCKGQFWGEGSPEPIKERIDLVWEWYKAGAHIIIYTGRQPKYLPETQAWLVRNEVPFHGICMHIKPGADVYIDDRALNAEKLNVS